MPEHVAGDESPNHVCFTVGVVDHGFSYEHEATGNYRHQRECPQAEMPFALFSFPTDGQSQQVGN